MESKDGRGLFSKTGTTSQRVVPLWLQYLYHDLKS